MQLLLFSQDDDDVHQGNHAVTFVHAVARRGPWNIS